MQVGSGGVIGSHPAYVGTEFGQITPYRSCKEAIFKGDTKSSITTLALLYVEQNDEGGGYTCRVISQSY